MSDRVEDFDNQSSPPSAKALSRVFHMVNRIIPEGQEVLSVAPDELAREALEKMRQRGFSQVPVKQGNTVLGVFSYRAYALEIARLEKIPSDLASWRVEEFFESKTPSYAQVTDDHRMLIDVLDENDAVIVSSPEALIAIVTPMDVLRYMHKVSSAFVLIEEIELAVRGLMHFAIPDKEMLAQCAERSLASKYTGKVLPDQLEKMTFDEYISIVANRDNWPHFAEVFGASRERVKSGLEPVRKIRNDVFHFRREISAEDLSTLAAKKEWLKRRTSNIQAKSEVQVERGQE